MSIYGYIRLNAFDDNHPRKVQLGTLQAYAKQKGFGEIPQHAIRIEAAHLLTPIEQRGDAPALLNLVGNSDVILTPHWGSLLGGPTSALAAIKKLNQKGCRLFIVELDLEVTSQVNQLTPMLSAYGHLESEIIKLEDWRRQDAALNEEMLRESISQAFQKIGERLAKVDFAPTIKEAIAESYEVARETTAFGADKDSLEAIRTTARRHLRKQYPEIAARLSNGAGRE